MVGKHRRRGVVAGTVGDGPFFAVDAADRREAFGSPTRNSAGPGGRRQRAVPRDSSRLGGSRRRRRVGANHASFGFVPEKKYY